MSEQKEKIVDEKSESLKIKKKPKKLANKKAEHVTKIDLSKKEEDAVQEPIAEKVVLQSDEQSEETGEESKVGLQKMGETHNEQGKPTEEGKKEEIDVIQEIKEEDVSETTTLENINKEIEDNPQLNLPENVESLVNFMNETGGTIEDYVRLNADYSNVSDDALLKEYYKNTKAHLDNEEIDFIIEDNFQFDEDYDDEKTIRKKKLAYKEEVAKAKNFLTDLKDKYYQEIKSRPGITQEQQKAMDFFNRYNEDQKRVNKNREWFRNTTKKYFTDEFEGFDFNVGEKRFRYNVQNPNEVADVQSDMSNFIKKFLNKEGNISDYAGYHKALYAARNADTIAKHFYEQGKADATKDIVAKSKNISNEPRATSNGDVYINGLKVKAISGVDSDSLKLRIKKTK
jgi:hypothetical protein